MLGKIRFQGNGADNTGIGRHFLTHFPVAPSGSTNQHIVLVNKGNGTSVELGLYYVTYFLILG